MWSIRCVAPHAGARIETRGLFGCAIVMTVAPHAGARIETNGTKKRRTPHGVAPHAGARIEIYKTRSGRHERKIAPHALTVPHFWALRAVQMCTVFATECCVYSGLLYGNKWDGDTAPTRNTALVGGFFHRTVAGKAKPAGWRVLASVLCVVIGSVVARCFIFPAGRAASTRFFRGFASGW